MMYKHLEDGTHQLSITGPELADITELIVSLGDLVESTRQKSPD